MPKSGLNQNQYFSSRTHLNWGCKCDKLLVHILYDNGDHEQLKLCLSTNSGLCLPALRSSPKLTTPWTASAAPPSAPRSSSLHREWSTCWVRKHTPQSTIIPPYKPVLASYCEQEAVKQLCEWPRPCEGHRAKDEFRTSYDVMAYLCLVWQGPAPLLCFSAFNKLWATNVSRQLNTENGTQNIIFINLWLCYILLSLRCGGGVPRHQACGAGHQGDGSELWETATAAEGHQPCVEQPHRLHVAGQARCKTLDT